jgi:hypothetical protein
MSIFKLLFAIIFDAADCLIGRIPLFGTVFDILGVYLTFVLCGPLGITYALGDHRYNGPDRWIHPDNDAAVPDI